MPCSLSTGFKVFMLEQFEQSCGSGAILFFSVCQSARSELRGMDKFNESKPEKSQPRLQRVDWAAGSGGGAGSFRLPDVELLWTSYPRAALHPGPRAPD